MSSIIFLGLISTKIARILWRNHLENSISKLLNVIFNSIYSENAWFTSKRFSLAPKNLINILNGTHCLIEISHLETMFVCFVDDDEPRMNKHTEQFRNTVRCLIRTFKRRQIGMQHSFQRFQNRSRWHQMILVRKCANCTLDNCQT